MKKIIRGSNNDNYEIKLIDKGDILGVNIGGILLVPKGEITTDKLLTFFQFDKCNSKVKDLDSGLDKQAKTLEDSAQRIVVDNNINKIIDGLELKGQVTLLLMLPNEERVKQTIKEGEKANSMDSLQRECFTQIDKNNPYYRIDEQIKKMIEYTTQKYNLNSKTNIFGHSAMGLPAMRYAMLQPQTIDHLIIGGNADEIPTPFGENGKKLQYPFGIKDYEELFEKKFDMDSFSKISFRYYIGEYEYLDPNLDGIRDDNYGQRRDGKLGTGDKCFAPKFIADEYKKIYNPEYKENYNFSVYERLQHVIAQYEKEGLNMKFKIYPKDCHTPLTAEDLKDAQFNDGKNFSVNGSKIVQNMFEKIKQLEKYVTTEPKTLSKIKYEEVTDKIFYHKNSCEDRKNRVEALMNVENEYFRVMQKKVPQNMNKSKLIQRSEENKNCRAGLLEDVTKIIRAEYTKEKLENKEQKMEEGIDRDD